MSFRFKKKKKQSRLNIIKVEHLYFKSNTGNALIKSKVYYMAFAGQALVIRINYCSVDQVLRRAGLIECANIRPPQPSQGGISLVLAGHGKNGYGSSMSRISVD